MVFLTSVISFLIWSIMYGWYGLLVGQGLLSVKGKKKKTLPKLLNIANVSSKGLWGERPSWPCIPLRRERFEVLSDVMKFIGNMRPFLLIFCFLFLFVEAAASGDEAFNGPWEKGCGNRYSPAHKSSVNPLKSLVEIFRDYISPVDGDRCPMYPGCSRYSIQSFEKHGLIIGWMMTCDRLLHEADEMRRVPTILVGDSYKFYDPVENNDFWWYDKK